MTLEAIMWLGDTYSSALTSICRGSQFDAASIPVQFLPAADKLPWLPPD
jgi:hypothetical protein